MGWWESHDGTVIGDELVDIVEDRFDKMVSDLVKEYPEITRDQVLHTMAFCSGYFEHFDKKRKMSSLDKILGVMTVKQMRRWNSRHEVLPDMSKRIAPDTDLMNVKNPFTGRNT